MSKEVIESEEIKIHVNKKMSHEQWADFIIYELNQYLEFDYIDMNLKIDVESDPDRIFIGDIWTIRLWNVEEIRDNDNVFHGLAFIVSLFKNQK